MAAGTVKQCPLWRTPRHAGHLAPPDWRREASRRASGHRAALRPMPGTPECRRGRDPIHGQITGVLVWRGPARATTPACCPDDHPQLTGHPQTSAKCQRDQ
ncbi:hypothetical protein AALO_G00272040 [Alosa alosa]|uniref:Uncharacterized protein n=1 Tax=Alosa alosa TaxID=278164 RepID=A0AAV6FMI3_9TELE|nr:hypothetical protein AALO_G00272040 [Alosa alosa]